MIFWTVVFITYYLASLVRGNLFHNALVKVGELTIEQAKDKIDGKRENKEIGKEMLTASWPIFLGIPLLITLYAYLFKAISLDIYQYPTLIMLFYILFTSFVLRTKKTKDDLTTNEGIVRAKIALEKLKRYTFKRSLVNLVYLSYFGYMFYVLVLR